MAQKRGYCAFCTFGPATTLVIEAERHGKAGGIKAELFYDYSQHPKLDLFTHHSISAHNFTQHPKVNCIPISIGTTSIKSSTTIITAFYSNICTTSIAAIAAD
jgi:hypothetical protein